MSIATMMKAGILTCIAVAMLLSVAGPERAAAGTRHDEASQRDRHVGHRTEKDCTRFNGRFGFYGNIWCSAAEQRAFDRQQDRDALRRR